VPEPGIDRPATDLHADGIGAFRVQRQQRGGLSARTLALALRLDQLAVFQLADDEPGGVVGEIGVAGEIRFGGLAQAPKRGQDNALVEQPDIDRITALTRTDMRH
jgi:hypothetical protein